MERKSILTIIVFSLLGGLIGGSVINVVYMSYFEQRIQTRLETAVQMAEKRIRVLERSAVASSIPQQRPVSAAKRDASSVNLHSATTTPEESDGVADSRAPQKVIPPAGIARTETSF
ncbi:hypothetical protein JXA32_10005 [Candidatus Sumerlaeota bacterium]|nr:hypothetical protein [Candidatus Sumerlaeota bacterium]